MRLAARFMSALLIASLLLPSLLAAPVAASGPVDPTTTEITASPASIDADLGTSTVTVQVWDADGPMLVGGETVLLDTTLGTLSPVVDNGTGTYTSTLTATTVGTATITGTVNAQAITDNATVAVTAGALDHIVISPSTASKVADVGQTYTAAGRDQHNNPTGDETGSTVFTIAGGTCAANVCKSTVAGPHTVTGTDGTMQDTATLTVTSAAAASITLDYPFDPMTAGVPHLATVTAHDTFGNVATGHSATVAVTSSDSAAVITAPHTLTAGVGTFTVTLKTAGEQSLTADDGTFSDVVSNITVNHGSATHLVVAGFADPTVAGAQHSFTVTARDSSENIVDDYAGTVTFTSTDPLAMLPGPYTFQPIDNGTHSFLGTLKTSGTRSITATDAGAVTGSQSGISVQPSSATHFTLAGFNDPTTAGAAHSVTITARDAFGNVAPTYTGTVHLTSSDLQAVLQADYTFVSGDNGVHAMSATLKTVGDQTITATDTSVGTINGTQSLITVQAASATVLIVSGFASPTVAGASHNVTVTAEDGFGNTATGYGGTVAITTSDGQAVLPPNHTLTSGTFSFAVTLKTAGTQTITATDTVMGSITGSQTGITVNPSTTTHFSVVGYPDPTTAGVSHSVTVTARDAFNNTVPTYGGTVTITSSDGAAVVPADNTLSAGVGTFAVVLKTVGDQSVTATEVGTPSINGTQGTITVQPAAVASFTVSGFPATTAGAPHNVTVTAFDAFNNIATGYAGTVDITSSDGQATLPASGSLTNGTGTFSVTLKTAGTRSISATDSVNGSITGTQTGIVVTHAAASKLTVTGFADPAVAGSSHGFTVTALDPYDNIDTGYVGTVHFTSTDAFAPVLPGNYTFTLIDAGDHSFSAALHQAGVRAIIATDTVTGSITGTQGNIDVTPSVADHLTVTGFASPIVAGTVDGFDVVVFDLFGNQATGYAGTLTFTSSDPLAVLPADSTITNGDGSFSATLKTVGVQSITATDTVSTTLTGSQGGIVVNPAAASHFTVTGYPSPAMSGVPHNVTVTALDAFQNLATGYAGTVVITSSDAGATLPANNTLLAGVRAFSVTLNTSGNQSITATDSVNGSISGSQLNIAVNPGPVDHIVISPSTASILATDTQTYLAEGFDAANNDKGDFTSDTTFSIAGGVCVINECSATSVGDHTVTGHQLTDDKIDTAILTILNSDPLGVDDSITILEDSGPTVIPVLANDTDINGDEPTFSITGVSTAPLGTVAINGSGLDLTYTPNPDANGADTFTYDIDDGNGGADTATVHVTITAVNDGPTFSVGADQTLPEQTGVSPRTVANFVTAMTKGPADESAQNFLSLTASNNATTLFAVQPSVNILDGTLTFTPAVNRNGVATVTLTLRDDGGIANGGVDATSHTFTITITGANHAPFAINDAYTVVSGSHTTTLPVLTNDNASNPDVGEILHITNVTQGTHGGTVTITGGGTGLTYKPKSGFVGTEFFTYRVKDATLFSSYATVLVNVPKDTYKPVATAPVQTIPSQTLGSSTVKVSLSWTGTDKGYGIAKFEVWQSTDGHSYKKIKTTTAHSTSATLTLNHVYRFRVRAIDLKNNIGSYAYGPSFKFVRFQETSAVYSLPWATVNSSKYLGGHARTTSTAGLTATLTALGRTYSWIGARGSTRGTADVYVDGILKAHVSLTSSSTSYRRVIYSITFPTSAYHAFQILYTGPTSRRVDLDAIVVLR